MFSKLLFGTRFWGDALLEMNKNANKSVVSLGEKFNLEGIFSFFGIYYLIWRIFLTLRRSPFFRISKIKTPFSEVDGSILCLPFKDKDRNPKEGSSAFLAFSFPVPFLEKGAEKSKKEENPADGKRS